MTPVNSGDRSSPPRMMSCVRAVRVRDPARRPGAGACRATHETRTPAWDRRPVAGRALKNRSCGRRAAAAFRSSGGRPAVAARASARRAAWPADRLRDPPRNSACPTWIRPDEERARRQHDRVAPRSPDPICVTTPVTRIAVQQQIVDRLLKQRQIGLPSRCVAESPGGRARRSACARVARTAAPLLALRMRNWMPASSVAIAIAPPSASTSLTR